MKVIAITKILSILCISQMILTIVFKNLPFPFSSFSIYFLAFLYSVLLTKPQLFLNKANIIIFFFLGYFSLFHLLGIYNLNRKPYDFPWLILSELLPVFISTIFSSYFINKNNLTDLVIFVRIILFLIVITCVTSIIGLFFYPNASRDLAGVLASEGNFELIEFYQKRGIANYDFFYGLAFAMPVFIMLLKTNWKNKRIRFLMLSFISIILLAIIKSQLTTALLFSILGIVFSLLGAKNLKRNILYFIFTIALCTMIPNQFYADSFLSLSRILPGQTLQNNLADISYTIENIEKASSIYDIDTHISQRAKRIPFLLECISKNPLIGGGESTGHNFWLDRISLFGLLGIIPWIFFLYYSVASTLRKIDDRYIYFYLLSIILFISIGFLKNSGGKLVYLNILFLVPSLLIIHSQKKSIF